MTTGWETASKVAGRDVLMLSLSIGLLVGFAQVAYLLMRVYVQQILAWHGRQSIWMIPAGEAAAFLVAGILLVGAGRAIPWLRTWAGMAGTLVFLAVLGLLIEWDRLHPVANLLLGLGLGAVAGRVARRWPGVVRRAAAVCAPAMLALVALSAVGLNLWLEVRDRPPVPGASSRPSNVLLIVLDTVRAAELSLYGYERPTTPNLERFARRGVRFDRAIATAPWTLPTHATLFTGRLGHEHGADWSVPLDDTYPTLAEFLSGHGYRTGGFVANKDYASWHTGLARGFSRYVGYGMTLREWTNASVLIEPIANLPFVDSHIPDDRRKAREVSDLFLEWQAQDPGPFFAFLNYYDAHIPYSAPPSFRTRFGADSSGTAEGAILRWLAHFEDHPSEREIERARAAYDASIAYIDSELGRLLSELERRNLLDRTLVIITSDHGEEFGEHNILDHGNSLYLPSLHVPLVLVHPARIPAGRVIDPAVSLRDVPATIVDLLDLGPSPFPGQPLPVTGTTAYSSAIVSELTAVPREESPYPVAKGDMRSVVRDSLHIIQNPGGRREIYNIFSDPWEMHDLAEAGTGSR